ncbi:MAG: DUF1674 domain-containing protein [Gammaproteobacteria bacterium]|nr:MAG: DUF1674 domain-containing protein [Gammaproteobacteria bacterium]
MPTPHRKNPEESFSTPPADPADPADPRPHAPRPHELGGRAGPEPTRFGDWEKNGRCIDF